MPGPRDITDVAIDSALHRLPEPANGWRAQVPPEDLGAMVDSGSGQITLQALIALLWYGNPKERAFATRALHRYADLCWSRFMLSEPWSEIYGEAIVCCWVAVVLIAQRIGDAALADRFRALLGAWAATSRLMEATAADGKTYVMAAGCRSWGHELSASGLSAIWRIASVRVDPPAPGSPAYGTPGAYDDWGWLRRCERLGLEVLRAAAAPYPAGQTIETLLAAAPRWAARTEMQLIGLGDGSRVWLMGDDESSFDDEDENGNTPGRLLAGVLGRRLIALPAWPNPVDGAERLRQTNCKADLDGTPEKGWTLWHSHLGQRRGAHPATGEAGFLSTLPPYTGAPLLFWVGILAGDRTWRQLHPHAVAPEPAPGPTPPGPAPSAPSNLRARLVSLDGGRFLLLAEAPAGRAVVVRKIHPDDQRPTEDRYVIEAT